MNNFNQFNQPQWNPHLNSMNHNTLNHAQFNHQYPPIYAMNTRNKSQFTSPQLNSCNYNTLDSSLHTVHTLLRSSSETQQYSLIPTMRKLQNEMSQLLYLIEIEKTKMPTNINLIQFYINLHAHKIQLFKRNIAWLPDQSHQMQILSFEDYCQQKQMRIRIPPSKIQIQNQTNNKNAILHLHINNNKNNNINNNNISPDSTHSISNDSTNSKRFIKDISRGISTQSTTEQTPTIDVDALKRSYSTVSMTRSISKQSWQSSLPETPTPNSIITYPISSDTPYTIIKYNNCNACHSIQHCQCIQNIIRALLFYQTYQVQNEKMNENDVVDFFSKKYINLLNDYHHILNTHLDCDTQSNNRQFELINKEFTKYIYCDINTCQQYKRNERNREAKSKTITNGYFINESSEAFVFTDFLDTIHCLFLHSFDTAYRIKNRDQIKHHIKHDEKQYAQNDSSDNDEIDNMDHYNCQDFAVENLKKYQTKKRRNICGLGRVVKHHKFCTDESDECINTPPDKTHINTNYNDDSCSMVSFADTESIVSLASLASIASTVNSYTSSNLSDHLRPHANTYSFGNRFYYWKYYAQKMEKDPWNHGDHFSQWYISQKYNNLKEELLYNNVHRLDVSKYNIAFNKARNLLKADLFKLIKCDTKFFEERYRIMKYGTMSLEHLMSLIFYTDYDELCYQFSKTFRKKCPSETYQSLKKRNSNYSNWARLLRESIECFGQKMKNTKIKIFYHGVSHMILNSLVCRFCGPTSTTPQIEVATIFSKKKGIILELEKYSDNLRYFNCSLVSCYANEDERLFFGGFHELNIRSVHELKQKGPPLNYRNFIRALSIFNQAIDGKRHIRINKVKKRDYLIINALIKHQLVSISVIDGIDDEIYSNEFPDYINSCFNQLVQTKKKIKINLHWLNRAYPGFAEVFIDSKIQNLVLFDVIGSIFFACTDLTVSMDQFDAARNITKEYLIHLAQRLKKLNNIFHSKLRKIKIEGISQGFTKDELLQQKFVLHGANWKLEIQKNSGQASSNILLTNLNMKRSKQNNFRILI